MDMKRLNTWKRKILSRVHGPVVGQGIYKDLDTAADINNKRLEWIGHHLRMDLGRVNNKIFESKQGGKRRM